MRKKGFTLIELIAVIAILAVLAVIAVPRLIDYVDKSKKVAIQTEAKNLYDAAERAYNSGMLIPTPQNVWDPGHNRENFEYIAVFPIENVDNGTVVQVLEKNNIISKEEGKKAERRLSDVAYNIDYLKKVINSDIDKFILNKDGSLNNCDGIPIKEENN